MLGTLSTPVLFENTAIEVQQISLNQGWTWVSMGIEDANSYDIDVLTAGMNFKTSGPNIKSCSIKRLISIIKIALVVAGMKALVAMAIYRQRRCIKCIRTVENPLVLKGTAVDLTTWSFSIKQNWNWLPFVLNSTQTVDEAMAYFTATDGNLIKSQNLFAVYDPINGWTGTLKYLEPGKGYMINSSIDQDFRYPSYLNTFSGKAAGKSAIYQPTTAPQFTQYGNTMNAIVQLPGGYDTLFVYDENNELKGTQVIESVLDRDLAFLNRVWRIPGKVNFLCRQ